MSNTDGKLMTQKGEEMTQNDFNFCYNQKDTKDRMPFGYNVLGLAYRIIPDADAALEIRDEVMAIGLKRCAEFDVETAWEGERHWPGFKKITRARCERMILRPIQENPLAKDTLKQWISDDPWAAALMKLSFRHRQIFLLNLAFGGNTRTLHELLNKYRAENEKKLTQKEVKNRQADAAALMVTHLTEIYVPDS